MWYTIKSKSMANPYTVAKVFPSTKLNRNAFFTTRNWNPKGRRSGWMHKTPANTCDITSYIKCTCLSCGRTTLRCLKPFCTTHFVFALLLQTIIAPTSLKTALHRNYNQQNEGRRLGMEKKMRLGCRIWSENGIRLKN